MTPLLIIGTGFSGLGLAMKLREQGREDFVVVERGTEVGGTWRDNTYPGCACDVPSHLYSYSFAPSADWSKSFSPQTEILDYLRSCADRFDVRRFIRFQTVVESLTWTGSFWIAKTSTGDIHAHAVALGVGPLSEPRFPEIKGLHQFKGELFHSSRWPANFSASHKRIGVIGTGASAVQFLPIIQSQARELVLFQRTAAWVVPRKNRGYSKLERKLYLKWPAARRFLRQFHFLSREVLSLAFRYPNLMKALEWFSLRQLAGDVRDKTLRKKLTPTYTIGCKRILLSDEYWPALAQPNVQVETDAIEEVVESGVRVGGRVIDLDALIVATGFHVTDSPFYARVTGEGGLTLAQAWRGSPRAYLGTMMHGFPNLFTLLGPNTGLGHTSVVLMIEEQIDLVLRLLEVLKDGSSLQPRLSVQNDYNERLDREMKTTVWSRGGCASWYLDRTGRNSTLWPKSVLSFRSLLRRRSLTGFEELK